MGLKPKTVAPPPTLGGAELAELLKRSGSGVDGSEQATEDRMKGLGFQP